MYNKRTWTHNLSSNHPGEPNHSLRRMWSTTPQFLPPSPFSTQDQPKSQIHSPNQSRRMLPFSRPPSSLQAGLTRSLCVFHYKALPLPCLSLSLCQSHVTDALWINSLCLFSFGCPLFSSTLLPQAGIAVPMDHSGHWMTTPKSTISNPNATLCFGDIKPFASYTFTIPQGSSTCFSSILCHPTSHLN